MEEIVEMSMTEIDRYAVLVQVQKKTDAGDDSDIYVKSEKTGRRALESVTKFLTRKLRLKVNQQKSPLAHPWDRKFLGFTFRKGKDSIRVMVHKSQIGRLKDKMRGLTKRLRENKLTVLGDSVKYPPFDIEKYPL